MEIINRNAPFGTSYTPTIRSKIIGGKLVYVKERPQLGQSLPGRLDSDTNQNIKKVCVVYHTEQALNVTDFLV